MQWLALEMLSTVCLAVHLWCINISAAGPLLAVLLRWQARRHGSRLLDRHARSLGMISLAMLAAGALTGLALAGAMWMAGDRGLFQILPSFRYKIHWAIWELVFYVVCMMGYIALFADKWSARRGLRGLQVLLAVLASTNLLYHFPPLFTVMAQVAEQPDSVASHVGPREFRQLMLQGHVAALTAHVALAALAVAAVVTLRQLVHKVAEAEESEAVTRAARAVSLVALSATAAQLLVGVWLLVSLDPLAQNRLLGGDAWGAIGLCLSVLATFGLLHRLAGAAFSCVTREDVWQITLWLAIIVLLMTITLRRAEGRPPHPPFGPILFGTTAAQGRSLELWARRSGNGFQRQASSFSRQEIVQLLNRLRGATYRHPPARGRVGRTASGEGSSLGRDRRPSPALTGRLSQRESGDSPRHRKIA